MTLYTDLGVTADATPDEIAKAHRAGVKRHHPDTGGDRAQFETVQRAALVLRDPTRRAKYDRTGDADIEPENAAAKVQSMMVNAFDVVIAQADLRFDNIADMARRHLADQRSQALTQQATAKKQLKHTKDALKRLRFKGGGSNPIAYMLEDRVRTFMSGIAQFDEVMAHTGKAIELAAAYDWTCDAKPDMSGFQYAGFTQTSGGW